MVGVLIGFAIIAVIIGTGYLVGRFDVLGANSHQVLSRLAFFVLSPALLFTVLAEADVRVLFSVQLPVATIAAVVPIVLYLVISLVLWRRSIPDATIGSLASGYVNANNIGIPVAVYVLGDATASAPVILLQLVVLAPIARLFGTVSGRRGHLDSAECDVLRSGIPSCCGVRAILRSTGPQRTKRTSVSVSPRNGSVWVAPSRVKPLRV